MEKASNPSPKSFAKQVRWHALSWSILVAIGMCLFVQSYQRWGHPIIDLGRDLYLPSEIIDGRVLYRDVLYNYGPIAPYFLAGIVAVFGDSLHVFEVTGIFIGLATMAVLYAIGVRLAGIINGFFSALLFLGLNFFAYSTWGCNFVLPYSYASTLSMALALWSLFFLIQYLYGSKANVSFAWSVVFLFLTLFTKQEVGFAIGMVHVIAWGAHKVSFRMIAGVMIAAILFFIVFIWIFHARSPVEHELFRENIAKLTGSGTSSSFFKLISGLDQPGTKFLSLLKSTSKALLLIIHAWFIGASPAWTQSRRWLGIILRTGSTVVLVWLLVLWAEPQLFQVAQVVAVILLPYFLIKDRSDPLLLLASLVVFTSLRILLEYHPLWYGFYLSVPAYPFLVYLLGERVPKLISSSRLTGAMMAFIGIWLIVNFQLAMADVYRNKNSILVTPKGIMRDFSIGRAEALTDFISYAREHFSKSQSMVVFPEGISLNYFIGANNPIAYQNFIPPEIDSPTTEIRMVDELQAAQPDYVVVLTRNLHEFGKQEFGGDYAIKIRKWIQDSYVFEREFGGPQKNAWRMVLFRKKP